MGCCIINRRVNDLNSGHANPGDISDDYSNFKKFSE